MNLLQIGSTPKEAFQLVKSAPYANGMLAFSKGMMNNGAVLLTKPFLESQFSQFTDERALQSAGAGVTGELYKHS